MVKENILIKQRKQELISEGQRVGFCIFKIGKLFGDDQKDSLQSLAKSLGSITNKISKAKGLSSLAHLREQLTQLNKKIHVKLKESFAKSRKSHPLIDKIRQAIEQKKKDSADLTAFEDSIYSPLRNFAFGLIYHLTPILRNDPLIKQRPELLEKNYKTLLNERCKYVYTILCAKIKISARKAAASNTTIDQMALRNELLNSLDDLTTTILQNKEADQKTQVHALRRQALFSLINKRLPIAA